MRERPPRGGGGHAAHPHHDPSSRSRYGLGHGCLLGAEPAGDVLPGCCQVTREADGAPPVRRPLGRFVDVVSGSSILRPWIDHVPPGTDPSTVDPAERETLVHAWVRRWSDDPDAPVFVDVPDGPPVLGVTAGRHAGSTWNAARFEEASRRAAGRLLGSGLVPGDRVVWSTASSVASLVAHVGALRAGLVVVPVNTTCTERELDHILGDVHPSAAIVDGTDRAGWLRAQARGPLLVLGPELVLPDAAGHAIDAVRADDPALICFTSGTTGAPKGAVLRHRHLLAGSMAVEIAWRWTEEDRLVHSLPIFHAHGLCVGIYGTLLAGACAVLMPGFDPAAVADACAGGEASLYFGVPTMYHRLLRSGRAGGLGSLRLCVSGSAPLPVDLFEALRAAVGRPVLERYGMTETLMNTSNPYEGERRGGTVGYPLPGVEIALSPGEEVLVRGPNVFDGYWQRQQATEEAFEPASDGGHPWFRTGDLGDDEDGYLVIKGRSKELIISGGLNVYPAEVEDVLLGHPSIAEVAVTGTPSDEWGEVVTAWVVADGPAPTVDELAALAGPLLAPYKRPRLVRVVDSLPRNAAGQARSVPVAGLGLSTPILRAFLRARGAPCHQADQWWCGPPSTMAPHSGHRSPAQHAGSPPAGSSPTGSPPGSSPVGTSPVSAERSSLCGRGSRPRTERKSIENSTGPKSVTR